MYIKILLISIVLLAVMLMGFGIKLFFNKNAKLPSGSCRSANSDGELGCACGNTHCVNKEEESQ
jgi:hypothetical protein